MQWQPPERMKRENLKPSRLVKSERSCLRDIYVIVVEQTEDNENWKLEGAGR